MSPDLPEALRLALEQVRLVRNEFAALSGVTDATATVIERSAASAILHSFYTEIEKILKRIALEWDGQLPSSAQWHRDLLDQMAAPTSRRPAVVDTVLYEELDDLLGFRHLFRGASIVLMQWRKLAQLIGTVEPTYQHTAVAIEDFIRFIESEQARGATPSAR